MNLFIFCRWATPGQKFAVTKLKEHSQIAESEYQLTVHERNIQVKNENKRKCKFRSE